MQYNEFIGNVQAKARIGTQGNAVRAVHATLTTLAERISAEEAEHLAAQLPPELGAYLKTDITDRFSLNDFFERVAKRENVDMPDATHHARAVISVLTDAVSAGQIDEVRGQLPNEFDPLFTAGSEGEMTT